MPAIPDLARQRTPERDARIEALNRELARADVRIDELLAVNAELRSRMAQLVAEDEATTRGVW